MNGLWVPELGWPLVIVVTLFFVLLTAAVKIGDRLDQRHRHPELAAEWEALERTRQIREVFLDASRAMQEEARHGHR